MLEKKHEHIVQLCDAPSTLSREQVWEGLIYFFKHPDKLLPYLEEVDIFEQKNQNNDLILMRTLNFGPFKVEDRIECVGQERIQALIKPSEQIPESSQEIKIEEPVTGSIFLRFSYYEDPERSIDKQYPEGVPLRRKAWEEKDKVLAQSIIEMANNGLFNTKH